MPLNPHNDKKKNLKSTNKKDKYYFSLLPLYSKLWNLPILWGWIPNLLAFPECSTLCLLFSIAFEIALPSCFTVYWNQYFFKNNYMCKLLVHQIFYLCLLNNLLLLRSLFLWMVPYVFVVIFTIHSKLDVWHSSCLLL